MASSRMMWNSTPAMVDVAFGIFVEREGAGSVWTVVAVKQMLNRPL
jgi:hypothetical protein